MTAFWILAALGVALALAFVLAPLLRWRRAHGETSREAANAAIYREQIAELEADMQRGALTREEFARATNEIERRVVVEHSADFSVGNSRIKPATAAILLGLLIPAFAGIAYWQLGTPRALDPQAMQKITAEQVEAMAERLTVRLQQSPDDVEGWSLLGRSLFLLGRHEEALRAFARALQLSPQDRDLLGEFLQALALAGADKHKSGDYAGAIAYWERILGFAPPESDLAKAVNESIADARKLSGKAAPAGAAPVLKAAMVQGTVTLDEKVRARAAPNDVVFVVARPASGSRMPLAVARTTVAALPYAFKLDDSMAMTPSAKLSMHASVIIVARVSKTGNPTAQKGDLEGTSGPVPPSTQGMTVVISRVVE
jgi:cytochrome c-type biogenesis protein CcmH